MCIFNDSERDSIQECSALHANEMTATIVNVFHRHVNAIVCLSFWKVNEKSM